jgi:hypothetical protein
LPAWQATSVASTARPRTRLHSLDRMFFPSIFHA